MSAATWKQFIAFLYYIVTCWKGKWWLLLSTWTFCFFSFCYYLSVRQTSGLVLNSKENSPDRWNQLNKINWSLLCRVTVGFDLSNVLKYEAAMFCLQKCTWTVKKGMMYIWNTNLDRNLDRNYNENIPVRVLSLLSILVSLSTYTETSATVLFLIVHRKTLAS